MTERQYKDSGIDWIGEIPNRWKTTRIKFIGETKSGDEIRKESILDHGEYPVYGGGKKIGFCNDYNANSNDILIGRVGSCGKINLPKQKAWATDNAIILRTKSNFNYQFLAYCLKCVPLEIMITQTAQPLLTATSILNCNVPRIALQEQQQIADFLDSKTASINSAIQAQKDIIEKLKEYKKAVITEAVTKGLNRDVEMKDSGIEWIGEVPSTWSVVPIKALFEERKHKNKDMQETNLLSLSYGNIKRKDINSNNGLLPENFSGYNIVETGDIVLRLTDLQNDHKSLRTGLVKEHGIITSAYVTLAPKHEVNSEYYHYLLHSYDIRKVFYTMGEGIRQSLDFGTLKKNVSILVPPTEEQKNIVEYINKKCESVENSIVRINAIIEKLEEYKKSIIYNAVTGKIDCRKDVIPE